jgi:hypothetical protein
MNAPRDELGDKIERWLTSADKIASTGYSHEKVRLCESMGFDWHETIAALQKALPRRVETVEEAEKLTGGTVIQDLNGAIGEIHQGNRERVIFWVGSECEDLLRDIRLPARILFAPDGA